jgi:hypothetical protein
VLLPFVIHALPPPGVQAAPQVSHLHGVAGRQGPVPPLLLAAVQVAPFLHGGGALAAGVGDCVEGQQAAARNRQAPGFNHSSLT